MECSATTDVPTHYRSLNVRDIRVRPEVLYVRREEDAPEEAPGVFSEFGIVIAYCFPSIQPCDQDEVIFRLLCI